MDFKRNGTVLRHGDMSLPPAVSTKDVWLSTSLSVVVVVSMLLCFAVFVATSVAPLVRFLA